jgi:hypothetical protein
MKDKEWCKKIEAEMISLKDRVRRLEGGSFMKNSMQKVIEIDIEWPEARVGRLHFNSQKTHGVFELKEDGNYYSRGILFFSARDTDERMGCDLLSKYLDSEAVREAFKRAIGDEVRVFLPEENQGVKRYNGVTCWYWLRDCYAGSAAHFCGVHNSGAASGYTASAVGGCAPVFTLMKAEGCDGEVTK